MNRSLLTLIVLLIGGSIELRAQSLKGVTWDEASANFKKAGGSFEYEDYVTPDVPDEENFGAIEPLKGITIPDGVKHESGIDGAAIRAKLTIELQAGEPKSTSMPSRRDHPTRYMEALETFLTGRSTASSEKESAQAILEILWERYGLILRHTDAAVDKPHAQFVPHPGKYLDLEDPASFAVPHLSCMISLSKLCKLRTSAAVVSEDPKTTRQSILTQIQAVRVGNHPQSGVIEQLVTLTMIKFLHSQVWEALNSGVFDEAMLKELQTRIEAIDFLNKATSSFRLEAMSFSEGIRHLAKKHPDEDIAPGVKVRTLSKEQIDRTAAIYLQASTQAMVVPLQERDYEKLKKEMASVMAEGEKQRGKDLAFSLFNFNFMVMDKLPPLVVRAESTLRQAATACALERYRLKNKRYPESLDELVPEFLAKVPQDPIDKRPMRYEVKENESFHLYSIGWDFKDDGGKPITQDEEARHGKGDWIWSIARTEGWK